jgi:bifunctional ADP-heptose synthase (sugar kinase/adenylyltransferase)
MSNLRAVDEVTSFDSDEQLCNIIKQYSPDVMVVGSDYKNKRVIGSEYAKELHFFSRIPNHSTTAIIKRISENRL